MLRRKTGDGEYRGARPVLCAASLLAMFVVDAFAGSGIAQQEKAALLMSATIERMHENAARALVTAAQDNRFADYFRGDPDQRRQLKLRIDQISLAVQARFHVEEMCLIDPNGAEISRIVGKRIAHDLASDEADAPFFEPGFAMQPRQVYISQIYMSPDADKWVLAYVTPVSVNGEKKSILHYEHALAAYSDALRRHQPPEGSIALVISASGHVIYESRQQIGMDRVDDRESPDDYFRKFEIDGRGLTEIRAMLGAEEDRGSGFVPGPSEGYLITYRKVGHWTVVVFRPA